MISVIICTKNRANDLAKTLEALTVLPFDKALNGPVEVIVVDNGSTDTTKQVADTMVGRLPLRYVSENEGGQSSARNAGLRVAQGDIIAFTDDDVRPVVTWLDAVTFPIRDGQGDIVAGGVQLAPHLLRPWMEARHLGMLASNNHDAPENISMAVGANLVFHRRVLDKVPAFDVELGPGASGFCDDLLFNLQVKKAGFVLVPALDAEATVIHHPDPARFTRKSFVSRSKREGESLAYVDHHWAHRDVPQALRFELKRRLRLVLQNFKEDRKEVPSWTTMNIMQDIAYYNKIRSLRGTPRNYHQYGLAKEYGIQFEA